MERTPSTMKPLLLLSVCLIATACQRGGERTQDGAGDDVAMASDGAGVTDASAGDLTSDVATDGDDAADALSGPACGEHRCGAGQFCIYEYCGIGPSQCGPPGDGGACPNGWILMVGDICPTTGKPGCVPAPCENPPPHCADTPAACGGHVDCSCIPTNVCDRIPCAMVSGTDVTCGAQ